MQTKEENQPILIHWSHLDGILSFIDICFGLLGLMFSWIRFLLLLQNIILLNFRWINVLFWLSFHKKKLERKFFCRMTFIWIPKKFETDQHSFWVKELCEKNFHSNSNTSLWTFICLWNKIWKWKKNQKKSF